MMSTITHATFPRAPLVGAAGLVALALVIAVSGQGWFGGHGAATRERPVAQRELVFADRADGAVLIYQAGQAEPMTVVTGEAGFLRGILRALARERRQDKLGHDVPFRLSAWPDGRLTLDDQADGQRIELEAFGPDNAAVFARLLGLQGHVP